MLEVHDNFAGFPVPPSVVVDTDRPGSLIDRPAHRAPLREELLGKCCGRWEWVVSEVLDDGRDCCDRGFRLAVLPVVDRRAASRLYPNATSRMFLNRSRMFQDLPAPRRVACGLRNFPYSGASKGELGLSTGIPG